MKKDQERLLQLICQLFLGFASRITTWCRTRSRLLIFCPNEQGYILGMVLIFFLIFSIMGLGFIKMASLEAVQVANYHDRVRALYNAEGGIHKAMFLLNQSSAAAATFSDSTVMVSYDSVNHIMKATGLAGHIQDSIKVTVQPGPDWPYLMFSDTKTLKLTEGGGSITGDLYSNTQVDIDHNKYFIDGAITVAPPAVSPPVVNWAFFENEAIAAGQRVAGDKTFDATGNPYTGVWYVTGNAKIKANAIINGTIAAEKAVQFEEDNSSLIATPSNYPAIVAGEQIDANSDNVLIEGLIYTAKDYRNGGDNLVFRGAIITIEDIHNQNGVNKTITYDESYLRGVAGMTFSGSNPGYEILTWENL